MLSYVSGDLFEAPVQTWVNTVNTVGVMGKGIALTFKQVFPEMFREYRELCEAGKMKPGTLHLYRTKNKVVLNFPTKEDWRRPSKLEYIEAGLRTFVRMYERAGIHSIAFPPLGCGNGELLFSDVRPVMERYLAPLPITVLIYAPLPRTQVPEHKRPEEITAWLRQTPSELPFEEAWSDILAALHERRTMETLTKGGRYEAQSSPDGSGIRFWMSGRRTTVVTKEEFCEVWKQLRDFGMISPANVPSGREKEASYILPVFELLPYVRRIVTSNEYRMLDAGVVSVALQLVPWRQNVAPQRELTLI